MHATKDMLLALMAIVRAALSHARAVAEQLPQTDRWKKFPDYVLAKVMRPLLPRHRPDRLAMAGKLPDLRSWAISLSRRRHTNPQ
jgi:hypothetical protein